MKRHIITIDESKCNGCGDCVGACSEGALQIVNGKAKLVKEQFCDGFGDCLGECPTGALKIETRSAEEFDFNATLEHVRKEQGSAGVQKMQAAAQAHAAKHAPAPAATVGHAAGGGCPGTRMRFNPKGNVTPAGATPAGQPATAIRSDLEQWPVQIHLVSPDAPFFKNRELVVLSTCAPTASADIHWRFIRGRAIAVGCPKLDRTEGYAEKLGAILSDPSIPRVIIVRMEVPCCGGLTAIVKEAVQLSGRTDLAVDEVIVGLDGNIRG